MKRLFLFILTLLPIYAVAGAGVINLEGNYEELKPGSFYQDRKTHIVYGSSGRRFMYAGQKEIPVYDTEGNRSVIKASCVTSELWADPSTPPPEDAELHEDGCQLQEISPHFKPSKKDGYSIPVIPFDWEAKFKEDTESSALKASSACVRYAGYAPPLFWSPTSVIGGHTSLRPKIVSKSLSERDRRSSFHTMTTSPSRS